MGNIAHYETVFGWFILIIGFVCGLGFSLKLLYEAVKNIRWGRVNDLDSEYRLISFIIWFYTLNIFLCILGLLLNHNSLLCLPFTLFCVAGMFVLMIAFMAISSKSSELTIKLLKFINGDR